MKESILKNFLVVGIVAGLILAGGPFSSLTASPIGPYNYDYGIGQAAIKVIDNFGTSGDESVTLSFISTFSGLDYQYGAADWTPVSMPMVFPGIYTGTLVVNTGSDHNEIVYFRKNNGNTTNTRAAILFSGFDNPLWNSVFLNFDYQLNSPLGLALATPGMGDHIAPIPIPASLWILGSGLLGLIGMRRKITH